MANNLSFSDFIPFVMAIKAMKANLFEGIEFYN